MSLRRELSNALRSQGYSPLGRNHHLPIDDGRSWVVDVGLLASGRPDVSPFAGVRFHVVETLLAQLWQVPPDPASASIGANVGYVLGVGYKTYAPPTTVDAVLAVIGVAQETLRPFLTIETFGGFWRFSGVFDPGWQYRDVIGKFLAGQQREMEAALEEAERELCRYEDGMCVQFRLFAQNIRKRMTAPS